MEAPAQIGIVVIGRNEGERLRVCLESLLAEAAKGKQKTEGQGHSSDNCTFQIGSPHLMKSTSDGCVSALVYVDSGSTDGSTTVAIERKIDLVELDLSVPFTAARARNEGVERLCQITPGIEYVQFVDGDCSVSDGWLASAHAFLEENPDYAVVCGRRREKHPEASIYNRLCDMEWNTPVGDAQVCGGDAMIRVAALQAVEGYDPAVIAGEEPELCVRLRQKGWKIRRLDHEMTLHDAAMTSFGQWWKRAVRGGYAYAQGAWMHGHTPARHWVKEVRSNWFWGLLVPVLALGLAWPTWGISLALLLGYPALACRIFLHMRRRGFATADARLYAWFCVLAKFAGVRGQFRFLVGRIISRPATIIEYKDAATVPPA